ncbi:MAG: hypothetical protein M1457_06455 [bacterium]|nr:hypothetical protein [bacterium]
MDKVILLPLPSGNPRPTVYDPARASTRRLMGIKGLPGAKRIPSLVGSSSAQSASRSAKYFIRFYVCRFTGRIMVSFIDPKTMNIDHEMPLDKAWNELELSVILRGLLLDVLA